MLDLSDLPELPEDFDEARLAALRILLSAMCNLTSHAAVFSELDAEERKSLSKFFRWETDLDFRNDREKIRYLYGTAQVRLRNRAYQPVVRVMASVIHDIYRPSQRKFAECAPILHDLYKVQITAGDRKALIGAYDVCRYGEPVDGEATIVRSALLIEAQTFADVPCLAFRLAYPASTALTGEHKIEPSRAYGLVLPQGRHTYFLGRDEHTSAPYTMLADRPGSAVPHLFSLFARLGVADRAFAARLLFRRLPLPADKSLNDKAIAVLAERAYKKATQQVGVFPAAALFEDDLRGLDWAVDNSGGHDEPGIQLWHADHSEALQAKAAAMAVRSAPKAPRAKRPRRADADQQR